MDDDELAGVLSWGTDEEAWGGAGAGITQFDGSTRPPYVEQFYPVDFARTVSQTLNAGAGIFSSYGNFQVARLTAEAAIARARAQLSATPLATWLLLAGAVVGVAYMLKK